MCWLSMRVFTTTCLRCATQSLLREANLPLMYHKERGGEIKTLLCIGHDIVPREFDFFSAIINSRTISPSHLCVCGAINVIFSKDTLARNVQGLLEWRSHVCRDSDDAYGTEKYQNPINNGQNQNSCPLLLWRETLPQHFSTSSGEFSSTLRGKVLQNSMYVYVFARISSRLFVSPS